MVAGIWLFVAVTLGACALCFTPEFAHALRRDDYSGRRRVRHFND
ncbi:hypothetical protein [Actinocorallia libanotica]|uniref:Uncharacterized protein n=1 Tax=Actinocorallia libanotica TaxID=46162 RepID=A0ABN1Q0S0_9ACTN